ncbi:MAG: protein kinase [Spirochaetales bacterium]|nr:protein kinase [Spirochaetales bacterium]
MTSGETIHGGYILGERLGSGLIGQTWSATAGEGCAGAAPGTKLVVKLLRLQDAPDWKALDRIQAEADALKSLAHPAIPRYIDAFRPDDASFVLVMERIPGTSLDEVIASGRRFAEADIERLFAGLLDILAYLHALRPPIIHRDVNPKNIILRPDGTLALVDFSGVQDAVMLAWRDSSTMVGTAGYAPVEQVSGRATIRSDLYAAAATAAFIATRRPPSDWPYTGMKPDPCAAVELSDRLRFVINAYLEPDESLRTLPPNDAAAILRGILPVPVPSAPAAETPDAQPLAGGIAMKFADRIARAIEEQAQGSRDYYPEPVFGAPPDDGAPVTSAYGTAARAGSVPTDAQLPSDSRVVVSSSPELFSLTIPRVGFNSPAMLFSGGFTLFWLGFVAFWTVSALTMGAPIFFAMFSLPFWAVGFVMLRVLLKPALSRVELTMSPETGLVYTESFLGRQKTRSWPLSDLGSCRVEYANVTTNGRRERDVVLETGASSIRFGRALSERERRAIAAHIASWLAEHGRTG